MATGNESVHYNMNVDEEDYGAMRESVSVTTGQYFICCSVFFFQLINWLVRTFGPPKSLTEEEWKWRNLYVSWVHSVIASAWVITCTLLYPELYSNLMQHINHMTYFCVCFSTGYFVYDFLDVMVNSKLPVMWGVGIHHITVAGMFYYNIHIKSQIAFNIVALTVEINSVFLHWRKLLQMAKISFDSPKYLLVKYINLISFVIFRGGPLVTISICCIIWRHKVSMTYLLGITLTTFLMDILNLILFWRLFKSDILRGSRGVDSRSACSARKRDRASLSNHGGSHVILGSSISADAVKTRKTNH